SPAISECSIDNLATGPPHFGAATGSRAVASPVTNTGPSKCMVPEPQAVTGLDSFGDRVALHGLAALRPGTALATGSSDGLVVLFPNTCDGAGFVLPDRRYHALEVGFDGGTLALADFDVMLCA